VNDEALINAGRPLASGRVDRVIEIIGAAEKELPDHEAAGRRTPPRYATLDRGDTP